MTRALTPILLFLVLIGVYSYLWSDTVLLRTTISRIDSVIPPKATSSTNVHQPHDKSDKPVFFLHVGPHKTGTTTIQNSFDTNPELHKDNYVFLGMRNPPHIRDTWGVRAGLKAFRGENNTNNFLTRLEKELESPKNLIVSEENFSIMLDAKDEQGNHFFQLLKSLLKDRNVVVAVGYRRYHEWLVSLYNERHKNHNQRQTFVRWYRKNDGGFRYVMNLYRVMTTYFDNVKIINVHDDIDIMTQIYCDILPNATYSCLWHKEQEEDKRTNPSIDLWPVAIASEAIFRNLTATNVTHLSQKVQARVKETNYALPSQCLSLKEQQVILEQALNYEKNLMPEFFRSPNGESKLRKGFARCCRNDKFCSVDASSVVRNKQWQDFFTKDSKV